MTPAMAVPATLRACDGAMPDGFLIPGTDACLRIGGVLRTDAGIRFTAASALAPSSFAWTAPGPVASSGVSPTFTPLATQARLSADLRTNTAYGPLRVFVSIRSDRRR